MAEGWISLHRKIRNNPIFNDMELLRLWLICLTEATHKEREQPIGRQMVHLEAGQFVTGRFDLQQMYNAGLKSEQQKSPYTVWRWLEFLQTSEFVSINSSNKYSVVSILNWDKYQKGEQEIDQQMSNKRATNEQQMSTNNNVNNDNNKKISRPKSKKTIYDDQSIPYRSAKYLLLKIREIKPDYKEPNIQTWADEMRKLIDLDGRDPKKIGEVIDWVRKDAFWQGIILSPSNLRKQWDKITLLMTTQNGKKYRDTEKKVVQVDFTPSEEERRYAAQAFAKQRVGLPSAYN